MYSVKLQKKYLEELKTKLYMSVVQLSNIV